MKMDYTAVITTAIFGAVIVFVGLLANTQVSNYLRMKAIDDCGKVSRFEKENVDERAKITYPVGDVYKACLKDKGIK